VLAECDMLDKVKDGVLEDPSQCRFDPSKLNCSGTETDRCLVDPQVATLKKLYDGPRNAKGVQVAPGYTPEAEADPQGWALWITGKQAGQGLITVFGTQFFQNMVYGDRSWDFHTFNWDRDVKVADEKMAQILNATNPDLTQFKKRGGRLIIYHGWDDAAIPAQFAIDYYRSVVSKMGKEKADEFVRLFMVPGMQHCAGGVGCNSFGQFSIIQGDPEHDINAALERWVEKGIAPNKIIAAKLRADDKPAGEVVRTHLLCPYPQVENTRDPEALTTQPISYAQKASEVSVKASLLNVDAKITTPGSFCASGRGTAGGSAMDQRRE
jgi:feruloyl esterase